MNTVTNRVVRLLGKDETVRFMNLTLYQGAPAKKGRSTAVSICDDTELSAFTDNLLTTGRCSFVESLVGRKVRA